MVFKKLFEVVIITGQEYEHLVASYLLKHGYTNVEVTKSSGDFGVDVIAHKGGKKYAVQCKYYSVPVGLSAIQEVVAGKAIYNCDSAMVVTNSNFTDSAKRLAKDNHVILLENVNSAEMSNGGCSFLGLLGCSAPMLFFLILLGYFYIHNLKIYIEHQEYFLVGKEIFLCALFLGTIVGIGILIHKIRKKGLKNTFVSFFNKLKRKNNTTEVSENTNDTPQYTQTGDYTKPLNLSAIIEMPCQFNIDGIDYNIDNINDINRIPMHGLPFEVNGKQYTFSEYFKLCANLYRKKGYADIADALEKKIKIKEGRHIDEFECNYADYQKPLEDNRSNIPQDIIISDSELVLNNFDTDDYMLSNAIDVVVSEGIASISLLQRRLKLGYARASRMIDKLEEMGIVGAYIDDEQRKVLITNEQKKKLEQNLYLSEHLKISQEHSLKEKWMKKTEAERERLSKQIVDAFKEFHIDIQLLDSYSDNYTVYLAIRPRTGVKISTIKNRLEDVALNLSVSKFQMEVQTEKSQIVLSTEMHFHNVEL